MRRDIFDWSELKSIDPSLVVRRWLALATSLPLLTISMFKAFGWRTPILVELAAWALFASPWWFFHHRMWRIHKRLRTGLCVTCGYDRCATPSAANCPECGAEQEAKPV